jgi:hypothetical protein
MHRFVTSLLVLSLVPMVYAANVHLKPPNRNPTFSDGGLTLTVAGNLAGLGNGDVLVTLTALADVTATCANQGGNQAPGQNPAPISVSGAQAIPEEEIKNGTTPFAVATTPPVTPIPGAPDCPNPNWSEAITDLAFTAATLTVEQPAGATVLTLTCTIAPPSADGVIPAASVSCQ